MKGYVRRRGRACEIQVAKRRGRGGGRPHNTVTTVVLLRKARSLTDTWRARDPNPRTSFPTPFFSCARRSGRLEKRPHFFFLSKQSLGSGKFSNPEALRRSWSNTFGKSRGSDGADCWSVTDGERRSSINDDAAARRGTPKVSCRPADRRQFDCPQAAP